MADISIHARERGITTGRCRIVTTCVADPTTGAVHDPYAELGLTVGDDRVTLFVTREAAEEALRVLSDAAKLVRKLLRDHPLVNADAGAA